MKKKVIYTIIGLISIVTIMAASAFSQDNTLNNNAMQAKYSQSDDQNRQGRGCGQGYRGYFCINQ